MRRAYPAIVLACATLGIASESAGQDRDRILRIMTSAADWQLAHPSEHASDDWTQAAFYTGMMALARSTDDPRYADAMRAMGEKNRWRPGPRPGHADDHAVVATYAALYKIEGRPAVGAVAGLVRLPCDAEV